MRDLLFAYGTILQGASDPQVEAAVARYTERVDAGRVPGLLYDLGAFPGAVPRLPEDPREHWVHGVILEVLDPRRVFRVLDPYEDCDPQRPRAGMYRRERATITPASTPEEAMTCQVYWINKVPPYARRIPSGDWSQHARERKPSASRSA